MRRLGIPAIRVLALASALLVMSSACSGAGTRGSSPYRREAPAVTTIRPGRGPAVAADPRPCAGQPANTVAFFNAMTKNRGDGWIVGDLPASIDLRDGRVLWLFGDTLVGARQADGMFAPGIRFWHNTAFVQTGGCVDFLDTGGPSWLPILGTPDWWWPTGGYVHRDSVLVFVERVQRTGPGVFDFRTVGSDLVHLRRRDLAMTRAIPLANQDRSWTRSVVTDGRWLYLFGGDRAAGPDTYLARAHAVDLQRSWQFWDGRGWSDDSRRVVPVLHYSPYNNPRIVRLRDGRWFAVAKDREAAGRDVIGWTATRPQGPWKSTGPLIAAPTLGRPGDFTYMASAHPEIGLAGGRLLISWNLNSEAAMPLDPATATAYGPSFAAVRVPRARARGVTDRAAG